MDCERTATRASSRMSTATEVTHGALEAEARALAGSTLCPITRRAQDLPTGFYTRLPLRGPDAGRPRIWNIARGVLRIFPTQGVGPDAQRAKGATSNDTYLLSIFRGASRLSFCRRDEAMRDAVTFATRDHVDAWYTEDGQAYESMARHGVQQRRG
jgi:hypothetical protein